MSASNQTPVEGSFRQEVADRFGVLPNFFRTGTAATGLVEDLWRFAKSAYLDNPLPSLFKERLFVHLSRFCVVRYCVVRHAGFLLGQGHLAGDAQAEPLTLEEVIRLLERPLPDAVMLDRMLRRMNAAREQSKMPPADTQDEAQLFAALTVMFLTPTRSAEARQAVRNVTGERNFELLAAFLAFVRTAHYWTETHPELDHDPDMAAYMERHPKLQALLLNTREAESVSRSGALATAQEGTRATKGTLLDGEERRRGGKTWLSAQKEAFQAAMNGAKLETSLGVLVRTAIEQAGNECRCVFYIVDPDGRSLRHVAGVPDVYAQRVDGFEILPDSLACGLAVAEGRAIITPDVFKEPRWQPWLWLAREHDYRACWSFPVETASGKLVGSLAMYFRRPRELSPRYRDLAAALAHTAAIIISRYQSQAALSESEEKYRALFETMGQGYCELELLRDADGRTVDQLYLEFNPAFERLFGIPVAEARNRKASEVFPELEPWWHEAFGRIAQRGEPERIEYSVSSLGRWFEVFAYPRGGDRLSVFYEDVTERKRRDRNLAFLAEITDDLSRLSSEEDILQTIGPKAAAYFAVSYFLFVDVDDERDLATVRYCWNAGELPPVTGTHRGADFLMPALNRSIRAGQTVVVDDTASDPRADAEVFAAMNFRSFVAAPFHQGGRWRFLVEAVQATPRGWRGDEIELMRELTSRICLRIQRARAEAALRVSEERLRRFGEASQDILWIRDAERLQWQYLTPAFEAIYGLSRQEALSGDNYRSWLELIVPEDRPSANDAIRRVRQGEHVTFDYRVKRPVDGAIRWLRNTDFPISNAQGEVTLVGGVGHDLTELHETELRFRTLTEGMPQLVWRAVDGGSWTWSSPQWSKYTGLTSQQSSGSGWLDALHPDDREIARRCWDEAQTSGSLAMEGRIRHAADNEYRWFQTRALPVRDEGGVIIEWLGTSTDVHDMRELQERQKVLVAELQHRTRNLMGVVRSMADKTVRSSEDLPDFRGRFRDRLTALARVQGLLSRLNEHDRVTFDELIDGELSALDGGEERVTLRGPLGVRLRSSNVQTIAMALHELATNAIKYGALGQPQARLAVTWSLERNGSDGKPWLHVDWRESGVAMPSPGAAHQGGGEGRKLIEQALRYQLRARTTFELGRDGVHCTISLPVSESTSVVEMDDA